MENILYVKVHEFLDDEYFIENFCFISKNIYLNSRRKKILRFKSAYKLEYLLYDIKNSIIDRRNGKLDSFYDSKNGIKILLYDLSHDFLMESSLHTQYQKKIYSKKKYAISENFMDINERPQIHDFENKIIIKIDKFGKLDPIYRMKPYFKNILIRDYPIVKALIY